MAWTASTFKVRFAAFAPKSDALVEAVLAEAAAEVDERVYGASYDHAVGLLAAHKLAVDPYGQTARQEGADKSSTTYGDEFDRLTRKRAGGPWVTGYTPGDTLT